MSSSESDIRIELIKDANSSLIQEIIDLADANRKTLGFLKPPAYKKLAENPGILVAFIDEKMVGYLMWSVNKKKRCANLRHLCIKPEYRGKQIAKMLNNALVELARNCSREIRLECKDHYKIDEMWRVLGYSSIFEKPAKTQGDTLKVWSMQFINPGSRSIFSQSVFDDLIFECSIDAYTLQKFIEENQKEGSAEWLRSYLGVCVTSEIFNEIDTLYSDNKKYLWSLVKSHFSQKDCEFFEFQKSSEFFREILLKKEITLDEISSRHISRCLASNISYFITKRNDLLNLSSLIYENTGLQIISIEEAIDLREGNTDKIEYQPLLLENKSVQLKTLNDSIIKDISEKIQDIYPDSNHDNFLEKLNYYNNQKTDFQCYILTYENEPYILFVYDTSQKGQIETPILRIIQDTNLTGTLLNFVVNKLLEISILQNCSFLKITDPHLRESDKLILESQYFIKNHQGFEWIKACYRDTLSSQKIITFLNQSSKNNPEYSSLSQLLISWLNSDEALQDPFYVMDIERLLWPLKIENAYIPNFIIPIKPEYAKELFDKDLAKENLFGSRRSDLFLSLDTVYYKSIQGNGGLKKAPARIFWYVSQCKDSGYSNISSIRACSQVDDVIIDTPEVLYKKFQHLGLYSFEQIKSCSKSKQVMAIKFSHTEQLSNPIELKKIQQCLEKRVTMQSTTKISQAEFITLYRLGFNLELK
ncbi:MAG: GNAT family N-acetyltransferase [Snowella sp.]|nr:GNAT family N-acetyltransferase [Snowella sp.]